MGCGASDDAGDFKRPQPMNSCSINRDRSRRDEFVIMNKHGNSTNPDVIIRHNDENSIEQYLIEDCSNVGIFLCDNMECTMIDTCRNMIVATSTIEGSTFIRDCENCDFFIASQQFRMRNCHSCRVFLFCTSSPIIESSSDIGFGCFQYGYNDFPMHLFKSSLNIWNNKWYDIFDFTPEERGRSNNHFHFFPFRPYHYQKIIRDTYPADSENLAMLIDKGYLLDFGDHKNHCIPLSFGPVLAAAPKSAINFDANSAGNISGDFLCTVLILCLRYNESNMKSLVQNIFYQQITPENAYQNDLVFRHKIIRSTTFMMDKAMCETLLDSQDIQSINPNFSKPLEWIGLETLMTFNKEAIGIINKFTLRNQVLQDLGGLNEKACQEFAVYFGTHASQKLTLAFEAWQHKV